MKTELRAVSFIISILTLLLAMPRPTLASSNQILTISANMTITEDTTWQDTIILDGAVVSVNPEATLTLKPGTTVAGKNGARISVYGKMMALGEEDSKIRFTEEENLNKNFSLTYSISTATGSEIELKNFILEKGGGNAASSSTPALSIKGSSKLSNGVIRRNRITAVRIYQSDFSLKNCEIYENESIALENKTAEKLKAEDNWWGDDGAPKTTTGSGGNWLSGSFDFDPWEKKGPIPIIILPGFGGSFSLKLLSGEAQDDWWLPPAGTATYRHFAKALILSNYYHNKDFFWGFYDWRLPCEESAEKYLEPIIAKAKKESGHFQVHLLAHSMGGLVARSYIQGNRFHDDVDRLVTAGTPHWGASVTYPVWEGGGFPSDKKPLTLYLWYLQALDWEWNRVNYIRENFPSLGQMRPIYDFLVDGETNNPISYKSLKGRNTFLESLDNEKDTLKRKVLTSLIAGTGEETLEKISVLLYEENDGKWRDGIPEPLDPPGDTVTGDGTVTVKSATGNGKLTEEIATIESQHGKLLETGEKTIFNQLKVKAKFPLIFETLHYFLLSAAGPVEVEISDQDGKLANNTQEGIKDSRFKTLAKGESNLIYADFPLASDEQEVKLKVTFIGKNKGAFKAAFWHLGENDELSKIDLQHPVEAGVKIIFEVSLKNSAGGEPKLSVENVSWANLLNINKPKNNVVYLNWQYLDPETDVKEIGGDIKDIQVNYAIDDNVIDKELDLGALSLGPHQLKAKGSWKINGISQGEEKETKFIVSTSPKSLMTLINRLYEENKLSDWETRSTFINLLAEAYQESSNGRTTRANGKIIEAKGILENEGGDAFVNVAVKERLLESLEFLKIKRIF